MGQVRDKSGNTIRCFLAFLFFTGLVLNLLYFYQFKRKIDSFFYNYF